MRLEPPEYVIMTPGQTQARMTPSKLGNTENYPLIVNPLRPRLLSEKASKKYWDRNGKRKNTLI